MADDENNGLVLKLIICLIAAASAAVVVTVYHCITARYARPQPPPSQRWLPPLEVQQQEMSVSLEHSVAELLPAHKHSKGAGSDGVDDSMCAICLCKFEEGEELRTLPECSHSFHVACIDMWLCSHWSCPMCRSAIGALGSSSPTLMHLLNPSSITHNTSPIETL
ncbi:RING-H2 finger protein ATL51-like [Salvia divinorum]|uniref:RING-H2 finger protein ATL51-like n=1 Tax=Salvia divinorum TaxID=28513 RepID=A0ABD1FUV4_SALDI